MITELVLFNAFEITEDLANGKIGNSPNLLFYLRSKKENNTVLEFINIHPELEYIERYNQWIFNNVWIFKYLSKIDRNKTIREENKWKRE